MKYICFLNEPLAADLARVGDKTTNLGKMAAAGFPVPPGFCLTADAYRYLIEVTGLNPVIARIIEGFDFKDAAGVEEKSFHIRKLIAQQPIPLRIAAEIQAGYEQLGTIMGNAPSQMLAVAVRSSATAENLPDASFAGQQDTYLNIRGLTTVLGHVRHCWASLWTARAITYRHRQSIDHQQIYLAVIIQAMIDPETSGNAFTANPINGCRDECLINASWGLSKAIVSGIVAPDTYVVTKRDGRIVAKHITNKERMIASDLKGGTVESDTAVHLRSIPALTARQIAKLTALTSRIEELYGTPQDIEWANHNGRWYIIQSRSITTLSDEGAVIVIPANGAGLPANNEAHIVAQEIA
jgi:pyruvate,water dikinase